MRKSIRYALLILISISAVGFFLALIGIQNYRHEKISRLSKCERLFSKDHFESPQPDKLFAVLLGDSRVKGWGLPDLEQGRPVINLGISGSTTAETLCMISDDLINLRPEWFILLSGINDLVAASFMNPTRRMETEIKTLDNLRRISELLSSRGSKVLVLTIPPPISPGLLRRLVWGSGIEEAAANLSNGLLQIESANVYVFNLRQVFYDKRIMAWKPSIAQDALHWNNMAYQALTHEVRRFLSNYQ